MDPIGLATLIGGYSGAVSAAVALFGFGFQLRKVNTLKVLRAGLEDIKAPEDRDLTQKSEEALLLECLNHASLIIPPFRQKLLARFISTLVMIAVISAGVSLDLPGQLLEDIKGLESCDLLLIPAAIFTGLINNTSLFLKAEEKEFLARLTSLQSCFYEWYVIPAMVEFNVGAGKLESRPLFKRTIARERRDHERIQRIIEELLKESTVRDES